MFKSFPGYFISNLFPGISRLLQSDFHFMRRILPCPCSQFSSAPKITPFTLDRQWPLQGVCSLSINGGWVVVNHKISNGHQMTKFMDSGGAYAEQTKEIVGFKTAQAMLVC